MLTPSMSALTWYSLYIFLTSPVPISMRITSGMSSSVMSCSSKNSSSRPLYSGVSICPLSCASLLNSAILQALRNVRCYVDKRAPTGDFKPQLFSITFHLILLILETTNRHELTRIKNSHILSPEIQALICDELPWPNR